MGRVDGAAGEGGQTAQLHPRQAGLGELLAPEVGLDEVDLVVDPLLHGGAVPAPLAELVLTLVNGSHGAESDGVHEARVPLAELDLKQRTDGHRVEMSGMSINLDNRLISIEFGGFYFLIESL